jgi:membrane-associated phospholipid phosphatase
MSLATSRPALFLVRLWRRHHLSIPLSLGAAVSFARLASELQEGDLDALDRGVEHLVDGWRGSVDAAMLGLTRAGDVVPMTLLTLAVLAALVARRRWREARYLFVGACGALALNIFLKAAFHRARPGADLSYLLPTPSSMSFPSGHTMGTTGVVGCLLVVVHVLRAPRVVRWGATLAGALLIAGVGLSRIYFGAHYPSDVLGGFLAAAAWVSALTGFMYPRLLPGETGDG